MTNLGLYLHIPFCKHKCAYCDFYSAVFTNELFEKYLKALKREIKQWGGKVSRPIDTIYLGGGTPSLLDHRLPDLLSCVKTYFNVTDTAEITLEINPEGNIESVLKNAKTAGVNRLSIGVQSGDDQMLKTLGRSHTKSDVEKTVALAKGLGFSNISLDLMLGLPLSSTVSLKRDLDFLISLNPAHISAYILKIEPNTVFAKQEATLGLPDEDSVCDQYLFMCDYLTKKEFCHYEISNFAKKGFESRHNLKYWQCEEYLGVGPAAHSFLESKRFFYPRDLKAFIKGNTPTPDGLGGNEQEKVMLALRLERGIPANILPEEKVKLFVNGGLGKLCNGRFSLTDKGMLVSNLVITEILENLYENT